jgi:hypothetical protein
LLSVENSLTLVGISLSLRLMKSFVHPKFVNLAMVTVLICPMGGFAAAPLERSTISFNAGAIRLTGDAVFRSLSQKPPFLWTERIRSPRQISIPNIATGLPTVIGGSLTLSNNPLGSAGVIHIAQIPPSAITSGSAQMTNLVTLVNNTLSLLGPNSGLVRGPIPIPVATGMQMLNPPTVGTIQGLGSTSINLAGSSFTSRTCITNNASGSIVSSAPFIASGVLTINGGTINLANQISVSSIQVNGACSISLGVVPAAPIHIAATILADDSGTAFASSNAANASSAAGAVFPAGTTIKVVGLTSATAICTITNNSGSDLNVKPSTTINGGIAISKP